MNAKRALNRRGLLMPMGVALTLVAMAFAGCMESIDDGGSGSDGTGTLSFYVKDAPADELESLFVTFSKVEVHKAGSGDDGESGPETDAASGGDNSSEDDNSTLEEGNSTIEDDNSTIQDDNSTVETQDGESEAASPDWIILVDEEHTVDLKAFSGDAKAFLGSEDVPAGKYTQIRIHVTEAWGILAEDGSRVEVRVPSDSLKIVRPWTVEDGSETALIVDFDLSKSVLRLGNGDWLLKPVMKLMIEMDGQSSDAAADEARAREGAPGGPPEGVGNSTGNGNGTNGKPDDAGPEGHGAGSSQASQAKRNETEAVA